MLAIIVPCFNEAIRFDLPQWQSVVRKFSNCHWFFVNDGSTDKTSSILNELIGENIHCIDISSNVGKGNAIRVGFNLALNPNPPDNSYPTNFSTIGFLDSDGAFDTSDIELLLVEAEEKLVKALTHRMIIGSRVKLSGRRIRRNELRHYIGRVISTFICMGWQNAPYDTQSGFKIFRVDPNFRKAIEKPFKTSWFFDIELILRLEALGASKIWEVPLMKWDEIGKSSIKISRYPGILWQIVMIRSIVRMHAKEEKF